MSDGIIAVPDVVNDHIHAAYATLHSVGLRVSIPQGVTIGSPGYAAGRETRVVEVLPAAGTRAERGAVVEVHIGRFERYQLGTPAVPVPKPEYVVPAFVGESVSAVQAWITAKALVFTVHLSALVAGTTTHLYENYQVIRQEPSAGSTLSIGVGRSWSAGGVSGGVFTPTPLTIWGAQQDERR